MDVNRHTYVSNEFGSLLSVPVAVSVIGLSDSNVDPRIKSLRLQN